jgi:hypothetical protein
MQGAKERRLRRTNSTPQGEAIEGNTADDALMVDQGFVDTPRLFLYSPFAHEYDGSFMGLSSPSPWTPIVEAPIRPAFFTHTEVFLMVCKGERKG